MAIDQVTTGLIKDNAVTSEKIPAGAIEIADVADDAITSAKIAAGAVDATALGADAVDGTKLADNAVNSEHIAAGAIDAAHMSANSIDSDQYVDGSIDNAHLADDAVGIAELSATGTASATTFLRGDNAWASPVNYVGGNISGGTVSTYGSYTVHTFLSSGHFINNTGSALTSCAILVVAGGG